MANAHVLISSQTLGSAVATVDFNSIPSTYRDLRFVVNLTFPSAGTGSDIYFRFNGDATSGNYPNVLMQGDGTSATSGASTNRTGATVTYWSGAAGTKKLCTVDVFDYAQTDKHKTVLNRENDAASVVVGWAARWASTSAITSASLVFQNANTFPAGCVVSLFGIAG
jgi:hypothetical protein